MPTPTSPPPHPQWGDTRRHKVKRKKSSRSEPVVADLRDDHPRLPRLVREELGGEEEGEGGWDTTE